MPRISRFRRSALAVFTIAFVVAAARLPASANEPEPLPGRPIVRTTTLVTPVELVRMREGAIPPLADSWIREQVGQLVLARRDEISRPAILLPLYVSYAALNGFDADSTRRAVRAGASEGNPVLSPFAGNTAAMIAVKTGFAAVTIVGIEKIRKKHPRAAIVFMAIATSAYAIVAAHNYRLAERLD